MTTDGTGTWTGVRPCGAQNTSGRARASTGSTKPLRQAAPPRIRRQRWRTPSISLNGPLALASSSMSSVSSRASSRTIRSTYFGIPPQSQARQLASTTIFVTVSPSGPYSRGPCSRRPRRSRSPWWRSPSPSCCSRAAARPGEGRIGYSTHLAFAGDPGPDLERLHDAGVTWIREDFLWDAIEPQQGRFDWRATDALMAAAAEHELDVLAILGYSARWASSDRGDVHAPPRDPAAYAAYARAVVERYGKGGRFWRGSRPPCAR